MIKSECEFRAERSVNLKNSPSTNALFSTKLIGETLMDLNKYYICVEKFQILACFSSKKVVGHEIASTFRSRTFIELQLALVGSRAGSANFTTYFQSMDGTGLRKLRQRYHA